MIGNRNPVNVIADMMTENGMSVYELLYAVDQIKTNSVIIEPSNMCKSCCARFDKQITKCASYRPQKKECSTYENLKIDEKNTGIYHFA